MESQSFYIMISEARRIFFCQFKIIFPSLKFLLRLIAELIGMKNLYISCGKLKSLMYINIDYSYVHNYSFCVFF